MKLPALRRFYISPPVAALLLAVILFLLSGLLPNGYGSDLNIARAQASAAGANGLHGKQLPFPVLLA